MIDKAKIEEWTRLMARIFPLGGMIMGALERAEGAAPTLAAATAALLAEREEMVALLRKIEWGGEGAKQEGAHVCPACGAYGGLKHKAIVGEHVPDCRLAALLR